MTIKDLISAVTKMEGGKKNLSRAQITEVVGIIAELIAVDDAVASIEKDDSGYAFDPTYSLLLKNGKSRLKKKSKK